MENEYLQLGRVSINVNAAKDMKFEDFEKNYAKYGGDIKEKWKTLQKEIKSRNNGGAKKPGGKNDEVIGERVDEKNSSLS